MKSRIPFALVLLLAGALGKAPPAAAQSPCGWSHDLRLVNGKIHTMDAQDRVVDEVTIQEGRFAYIGSAPKSLDPCTKLIDLQGRTVIPGLIDDHNHFVLFSRRPGNDVMVETATSIPEAMAMLRQRARTAPAGAWVTAIGDWTPRLFAEQRAPTLAELDGAVPNHPVLFAAFGPAVTNSLGKQFFESKGIKVDAAGSLNGAAATAALNLLRGMQTDEDRIRSAKYAQAYVLRYGLTTSVDMGVFARPGSPDLQDSATLDGIASANPCDAYMATLYPAESNHMLDLAALQRRDVTFVVARADGRAVGCGSLLTSGDSWAEIERMFVSPAARGQKLGRGLLEKLERIAIEKGCSAIEA
jgi:predicted amidohydrolase YtcJ